MGADTPQGHSLLAAVTARHRDALRSILRALRTGSLLSGGVLAGLTGIRSLRCGRGFRFSGFPERPGLLRARVRRNTGQKIREMFLGSLQGTALRVGDVLPVGSGYGGFEHIKKFVAIRVVAARHDVPGGCAP